MGDAHVDVIVVTAEIPLASIPTPYVASGIVLVPDEGRVGITQVDTLSDGRAARFVHTPVDARVVVWIAWVIDGRYPWRRKHQRLSGSEKEGHQEGQDEQNQQTEMLLHFSLLIENE